MTSNDGSILDAVREFPELYARGKEIEARRLSRLGDGFKAETRVVFLEAVLERISKELLEERPHAEILDWIKRGLCWHD